MKILHRKLKGRRTRSWCGGGCCRFAVARTPIPLQTIKATHATERRTASAFELRTWATLQVLAKDRAMDHHSGGFPQAPLFQSELFPNSKNLIGALCSSSIYATQDALAEKLLLCSSRLAELSSLVDTTPSLEPSGLFSQFQVKLYA